MSENDAENQPNAEQVRRQRRKKIESQFPDLVDWHQNSHTNTLADTDKRRFDAGIDAMAGACDKPRLD